MNPAGPHAENGWRGAFRRLAQSVSTWSGSAWAFLLAVGVVAAWLVTGPLFHYSDTWQLVINTGTTIVTFLMVFLIQNTQNRDATAIHLKLDELIRAVKGARNDLVDLEELTDEEIEELRKEFRACAQRAKERRRMRAQAGAPPAPAPAPASAAQD